MGQRYEKSLSILSSHQNISPRRNYLSQSLLDGASSINSPPYAKIINSKFSIFPPRQKRNKYRSFVDESEISQLEREPSVNSSLDSSACKHIISADEDFSNIVKECYEIFVKMRRTEDEILPENSSHPKKSTTANLITCEDRSEFLNLFKAFVSKSASRQTLFDQGISFSAKSEDKLMNHYPTVSDTCLNCNEKNNQIDLMKIQNLNAFENYQYILNDMDHIFAHFKFMLKKFYDLTNEHSQLNSNYSQLESRFIQFLQNFDETHQEMHLLLPTVSHLVEEWESENKNALIKFNELTEINKKQAEIIEKKSSTLNLFKMKLLDQEKILSALTFEYNKVFNSNERSYGLLQTLIEQIKNVNRNIREIKQDLLYVINTVSIEYSKIMDEIRVIKKSLKESKGESSKILYEEVCVEVMQYLQQHFCDILEYIDVDKKFTFNAKSILEEASEDYRPVGNDEVNSSDGNDGGLNESGNILQLSVDSLSILTNRIINHCRYLMQNEKKIIHFLHRECETKPESLNTSMNKNNGDIDSEDISKRISEYSEWDLQQNNDDLSDTTDDEDDEALFQMDLQNDENRLLLETFDSLSQVSKQKNVIESYENTNHFKLSSQTKLLSASVKKDGSSDLPQMSLTFGAR